MTQARVLGALGTLVLCVACGGDIEKPGDTEPAPAREPRTVAPLPPAQTPELPDTGERDSGGNRIDDVLDERIRQAKGDSALLAEPVRVKVILGAPLEQAELDDFVADGGQVRYVFRALSYGFVGSIALGKLEGLARYWGAKLHLLAAPSVVVPFLDEATRTGRVRGIWAGGFAGNVSGYSGNSDITIAVLDTGVYEQHPDLSGRKQGWEDYTSDGAGSPRDVGGHGTHVAAIALGSGAAFGSSTSTLKYTQSADISGFPADTFAISPIHTPAYFGSGAALVASAQAAFLGGGSASLLTMSAGDGASSYTSFGGVIGTSPLVVSNQNGGNTAALYQGGLIQTNPPTVTNFAVANSVVAYPGVGDGFNAFRGVAPSSKWFGAKVFTDAGSSNGIDTAIGLDDLVSRKVTENIKIVNLSLGVMGSGTDTVFRAMVNSAVDAGVVVVVAAGNDFPDTIGDPGRAAKVITVGAANDLNQLTTYSSIGATSPSASEDNKPDLLAPGGSEYRSQILAADTGTADGKLPGFADLVADDYANLQGTSMATPFVSGSIALMIDALQQSGTSWSFASSAQPLFLKMLLLASATETNTAREQGAGSNPTLGRATTPKDRLEGYGIINPDAAIEAMVQAFVSPLTGSVSNVAPARLEWERRAWGRNLNLVNGATVLLNLAVPATGDYDLYLYSGSPDSKGNPLIRASSVNAGSGTDETIAFASSATETAYVFVKRVSGHGSFSLTGSAVSHCGDGNLDTGELCDPAIAGPSAVCCTSTCTTVSDGSSCNDGDQCTQTDTCQAGSCGGSNPKLCTAFDSCHTAGTCAPATGLCSNPQKMDGATCNDGNQCTQTDTCATGVCGGSNPVTCSASDQCHSAGTCAPATGLCSNPAKTNGSTCDDASKCTQTDSCQSGTCTGGNPVVCTASDQCHDAGTCAPATGLCSNPTKTNGTSCNDGDQCTQTDGCQAGSCVGTSPVVCAASGPCRDAGTCDPASGACTDPAKPDGTTCNDGSQCTQSDTCQAGSCTGADPVVCAASDACHAVGVCDPVSGFCSDPVVANGTACDDGDDCTLGDACFTGVCLRVSDVLCTPPNDCQTGGVCSPEDGGCSFTSKPDGTNCGAQGSCQAGACVEPGEGQGGAGSEPSAGGEAGAGMGPDAGAGNVAGSDSMAGSSNAGASDGDTGTGAVGASAGTDAVGGTAPLASDTSDSRTVSGCGCSVPGAADTARSAWLLLAGVALLRRRRAA